MGMELLLCAQQRRFLMMNKQVKYDTFEDELDAIRLKLYEETKNMSSEEQIAYLHECTAPFLKKYGITPI
jgi:hypothetical protein